MWKIERADGFWYVTRTGRVPSSFLMQDQYRAEAAVYALNTIEEGDFITVAATPGTRIMYVPRVGEES